jgi:hypothetical protein
MDWLRPFFVDIVNLVRGSHGLIYPSQHVVSVRMLLHHGQVVCEQSLVLTMTETAPTRPECLPAGGARVPARHTYQDR